MKRRFSVYLLAAIATPILGGQALAAEGPPPSDAAAPAPDTATPQEGAAPAEAPGGTPGTPGQSGPAVDDLDLRNLRNVFGLPEEDKGQVPPEVAHLPSPSLPFTTAVLRGLDKITARVSTFDAPVDQPVRFGTLEVVARACKERPPTETPESAAFLDVKEFRPDEKPDQVFQGWMFASSPSLSALEHPVYDISVISCKDPVPGTQAEPTPVAAPAPAEAKPPTQPEPAADDSDAPPED